MEWGPPKHTGPKRVVKELFDERGVYIGGITLLPRPCTHFLVDTRGKVILHFKSLMQLEERLVEIYECRRYAHKQLPLERG